MGSETVVVYTCVADRYERELMPVVAGPAIRFVCFTDDLHGLKAPGWEMRPLESPARLTSGHDINRFHKLFPHRLFPDSRWSIYMDGNLRFGGDFRALVSRAEGNGASLGAFWHPEGHTLEQEALACKRHKLGRREIEAVDRQLAFYASKGIGSDQRIPTNNLLVRDHQADRLDVAMSIWWSQLFEFTKRDQISLLYALKEAGIDWQPLDGEGGIEPSLVAVVWHKPRMIQRIRRRLRHQLGLITER